MRELFSAEMSDRKFNRLHHVRMLLQLRHAAFFVAAISLPLFVAACVPSQSSLNSAAQTSTAATSTTQSSSQSANRRMPEDAPPIASAHNSAMPPMSSSSGDAFSGSNDKQDVDTSALDAKIAQNERKARTPNATNMDKRAAAAAYLERGKIFMSNGQREPRVYYRLALGDFRKAARYDPDNKEARDNIDLLVSIYQSMNRPVPDIGNEP